MQEDLLQYIWACGYFNQQDLRTVDGEALEILSPGQHNRNQGPDFTAARIRLQGLEWVGKVELHVRTSDWHRHGHQHDPQYNPVMLHVVWEHDSPGPSRIPVLELQGRIAGSLLATYTNWMLVPDAIPCAASHAGAGLSLEASWKMQLLEERLSARTTHLLHELGLVTGHWEELCWRTLARNFGYQVNADAFESLARSVPWKLVLRYRIQIHQLEALLFGQSRLLEERFDDPYPQLLQKEYAYLRKLHHLVPIRESMQFLRMRPGNFPTVRLAQLAALLHAGIFPFDLILGGTSLQRLQTQLDITANDFWHYHYRFQTSSGYAPKRLGISMIRSLLINTMVPVRYAYGLWTGDKSLRDSALAWLAELPAESDQELYRFVQAGLHPEDAAASQALHQLWKHYCSVKRCLDCAIGQRMLRPMETA